MAKRSPKSGRKAIHYRRGDALLIIDGINDLNFPGAEKVLPWRLNWPRDCPHFEPKPTALACRSFTSMTILDYGIAAS